MKGQNKRENNLSIELMELRQRIIELETLANERKRTEEALRKNEKELREIARENAAMAEIGRIISSSLNINEVYEQFGEEVSKVIPLDRVAITIINHEKGIFYNAYIVGHDVPERGLGKVTPLAGSLTEEVMRRRSSQLIQTEDRDEVVGRFPALLPHFQGGIRSFMAVPLISKNQVIGVLHIFSVKPKAYAEAEKNLAESIGNQIAGAIANSQLFIERKRVEEEREKLICELQDALAKIKTLRGLLPICSSCKKIRDDKGYWNQIEAYLRDHSEAEFSHGICPECLKKLYPGFSNEE
jgi:transcriptional regulator with GAF, ATPase, and Fis domain